MTEGPDPSGAAGVASAPRPTGSARSDANPFQSFWMGGYEGADHVNGERRPIDITLECGHLAQLEDDHRRAAELGIRTVRESIGWRLAEPESGRFDLTRAIRTARSARFHGLQVVWSLMHYGTPADVNLYDDAFVDRFVRFAVAVADRLAPYSDSAPIYNPINEISFVAWSVSATNLMYPYRSDAALGGQPDPDLGYGVKKRLIRATLEAMAAMKRVDPRARFLHVDPMVHVVPPYGRPDLADHAEIVTNYHWQTWDMVEGRLEPQLGGTPEALDLIGINHYHNSQWENPSGDRLWWHLRDARRKPFGALLRECWDRYHRPMIVAETSHFGDGRALWLNQIAGEVRDVRDAGLPVHGICLYPLIDRPDWTHAHFWHHSGLWDVVGAGQHQVVADAAALPDPSAADLRRVLATDYAEALKRWERELPERLDDRAARPWLVVFSHLRWDGLWHRPQQLTTRLTARYQILFVEEPVSVDLTLAPQLDRIRDRPGIEILVPMLPAPMRGFDVEARESILPLLVDYLHEAGIRHPIVWCNTPLALPLAEGLAPRALVYDCIDDLSGFDGASPELATLEPSLLRAADLVLCAGPSLAALKAVVRPDVHCIGNGADAALGSNPLDPDSHDAREAALAQASIGHPRLGYAGAIDERLDLALLEQLARAHPDWHLVLVGPICKIAPETLPRRPNLHWLPRQPHARLPYLYASWDACLLPFAVSEATVRANPTKVYEYLAAGRPVIATALPDVVALHGERVRVACDAASFAAACAEALTLRDAEPTPVAAIRTWDRAIDEITFLLEKLPVG